MPTVPVFRRNRPKPLKPREVYARTEMFRGSARERGYTTQWDKLRNEYFAKHPVCEEHLRRGYLLCAEVVDHMIPITDDPDHRLNPANLDSLCADCHNGWKRRIERFARQTGQIESLPLWIKRPDLRPGGFTIRREGPVNEDGTIG